MRNIFLFLILHCICLEVFCQGSRMYIPYRRAKLWGYADTSGKVVIEPRFTIEPDFFGIHGVARVYGMKDGKRKTGIIDSTGKIIADIKYDEMRLSQYLIGGKINGRYDIINRSGKTLKKSFTAKYDAYGDYMLAGRKDSAMLYHYDEKTQSLKLVKSYGGVERFCFLREEIVIHYLPNKGQESGSKVYDMLGKLIEENYPEKRMVVDEWSPGDRTAGLAQDPGICQELGTDFWNCNSTSPIKYIVRKGYYMGVIDDACNVLLPFNYNKIHCLQEQKCYDSYDEKELIFQVEKGIDNIPMIVTTAGRENLQRYSSIEKTEHPFRYKTSRNNLLGLVYVTPSHMYELTPAFKDLYVKTMMGDMVLYRIMTVEGQTGFINDRGTLFFE